MPKTSVALSDHFSDFAERQVASGQYESASEVVQAGLKLLEELEDKRAALRAAIQAGIDSGPAVEFDLDAFLAERHAERAAGSCAA